MEAGESAKPRVNASMLSLYQGRMVCLLGIAHGCEQNGMSFKIRTSDQRDVTIVMREALTSYIEGLVEVTGTVGYNNNINCENVVTFPEKPQQVFDTEQYNKAIQLIELCPKYYRTAQ